MGVTEASASGDPVRTAGTIMDRCAFRTEMERRLSPYEQLQLGQEFGRQLGLRIV
jgi:hypothetical protein